MRLSLVSCAVVLAVAAGCEGIAVNPGDDAGAGGGSTAQTGGGSAMSNGGGAEAGGGSAQGGGSAVGGGSVQTGGGSAQGGGTAVDAGDVDSGAPDAGAVDGGSTDAGSADAGPLDAGVNDAGVNDAGALDAGSIDSGVTDAGPIDAGVDAGLPGLNTRPNNTTCIAPAPPPNLSGVTTQRVFTNLTFSAPMLFLQAPGNGSRNYVLERGGYVRTFPNVATAMPSDVSTFLDIHTRVDLNGEGGFLGFAFHPNWPTTAEVYVSYTETSTPLRSVIARYRSTNGGVSLDASSEERLLTLEQPFNNHNGGNLAFGPDGFLYIGFGDGGSGGDPYGYSQNTRTLLGKMLRIDVNVPVAQKYGIPPSNPYASSVACNRTSANTVADAGVGCAEMFALGLRNPWRWSFDPVSGELWVGDVGQNSYEEVDRVVLGGNYGWNVREAAHCFNNQPCSGAGLIDPLIEYDHSQGVAVTGGYTYRGTLIPALVGKFIFGDYGSGRIWAANFNASTGKYERLLLRASGFAISSFGQTVDGEVYVVDINTGQLHQLVPSGAVQPDTFPQLLSQTGCFDSTDPRIPLPALVPYSLNATLWSDGASKERYFAVPNGGLITVNADGDFDFPPGSVLAKTFSLNGKRVETRLLMRHTTGEWAGYTYEWNDQETDATLLPAGKTKAVGTDTWTYPSRAQCLVCHTSIAGRSLGPELGQLNRPQLYPATGRTANQLDTLSAVGFFNMSLAPSATQPRLEEPFGQGALDLRARAYLHANCSGCHRLNAGQGPADFRYTQTFKNTNTCNVSPQNGTLGVTNAKLLAPGDAAHSIISLRTHALDASRMPPIGSAKVDVQGTTLLDQWINSVTSCPP